MKKEEKLPPIIEKTLLLEVEKTFRRIWDKEQKTEELFKKATYLHEQIQSLFAKELCKPKNEQNPDNLIALRNRLRCAEEAIDTIASFTKEIKEIRDYFYGFMSEPREIDEK